MINFKTFDKNINPKVIISVVFVLRPSKGINETVLQPKPLLSDCTG